MRFRGYIIGSRIVSVKDLLGRPLEKNLGFWRVTKRGKKQEETLKECVYEKEKIGE